jgi:hypothetical protein
VVGGLVDWLIEGKSLVPAVLPLVLLDRRLASLRPQLLEVGTLVVLVTWVIEGNLTLLDEYWVTVHTSCKYDPYPNPYYIFNVYLMNGERRIMLLRIVIE